MRCGIYGRVSTYIQREKHTIENQREANNHFAVGEKIEIYKDYYDDGVSSSFPLHKRPGGSELLRDARAKRFDCVIVYKLDRLGRSAFEILQIIKLLEKLGIALFSVRERLETSTPLGRMMITIIAAFAELEKETIRERTIAGSRRLASLGKNPNGNPAYGYRIEDGYWVIVEEEARIVRRIFKHYRRGLSAYKIAEKINELCPAPEGGKWASATIGYMIKNEDYAGRYVYGKNRNVNEDGKVRTVPADEADQISIEIPAIVTRKVWDDAQRQRELNRKHSKRNSKRFYLLSSLMECGACGLSYVGHTTVYNGREFVYYNCSSSSRRMTCGTPSIRAKHLEAYVWNEISGFIKNPMSVIQKLTSCLAGTDESRSGVEKEISLLNSQLKQKEKFKERIVKAIGNGVLSDGDAKTQIEDVSKLIAGLKKAKNQLLQQQGEILLRKDGLNNVESVLSKLSDSVDKADNDTKAMITKGLVEKVVIEPDAVDAKKPPRAVVHYLFNCNQNASPL
jgi:site-specific DNA recombinase